MNWSDVLADPSLNDLPYKIETNQYGQIVMSPASNQHSFYQSEIFRLLLRRADIGRTQVEVAIETTGGVKVPDVVWMSAEFVENHREEASLSRAPELCIEVHSPSNTHKELAEKRRLYFAIGAQEAWECDLKGAMTFYNQNGPLPDSKLFPRFPKRVSEDAR